MSLPTQSTHLPESLLRLPSRRQHYIPAQHFFLDEMLYMQIKIIGVDVIKQSTHDKTEYLEQPSSLRPFRRKLIALTQVASGACQHDKIDIVPRSFLCATGGDCMLNMVDVSPVLLFEFGMSASSIVTAVFLSFQLSFNLLSGKGST